MVNHGDYDTFLCILIFFFTNFQTMIQLIYLQIYKEWIYTYINIRGMTIELAQLMLIYVYVYSPINGPRGVYALNNKTT